MKRARHGSLWLSLTPEGLLARLATLVPPPRVHGVRYHGVFAPHAGLRTRELVEAKRRGLSTFSTRRSRGRASPRSRRALRKPTHGS